MLDGSFSTTSTTWVRLYRPSRNWNGRWVTWFAPTGRCPSRRTSVSFRQISTAASPGATPTTRSVWSRTTRTRSCDGLRDVVPPPGDSHLRLPDRTDRRDGRSQHGRHRLVPGQETVYRPAAPLRAHGLAASADYQILVSGSRDRTSVFWDLSRLTFIRQLSGNVAPPLVHPPSRPSSNRWSPPQKNRKKNHPTKKRPCPRHYRDRDPCAVCPSAAAAKMSWARTAHRRPSWLQSNRETNCWRRNSHRESTIHQTTACLIPFGPLNPQQQPGVVKKSRHVLKEGPSIRLRLFVFKFDFDFLRPSPFVRFQVAEAADILHQIDDAHGLRPSGQQQAGLNHFPLHFKVFSSILIIWLLFN